MTVIPTFHADVVAGGETLWLSDDEEREIFLSPMIARREDGRPWLAAEILKVFPPPELPGTNFERHNGNVDGRGLWMRYESDTEPPCWGLMSLVVYEPLQKMVRCSIVTPRLQDLPWVLGVWHTIVFTGDGNMPVLDASML